jgi:NTP pyrophosphatase (non-canonical NTP hydrolase)
MANEYVRPLPCVRDEGGDIAGQSVKRLFAKIDEELNELKQAVYLSDCLPTKLVGAIADEAADTITAITTLCHALGIDAKMRDEAQRRVNRKNMERGRL